MPGSSFKILIPEELKRKRLWEMIAFIRRLSREVKYMPTTLGCISLREGLVNEEKMFDITEKMYTDSDLKRKIVKLKKDRVKHGDLGSIYIDDKTGIDLEAEVASKHPEIVDEFELNVHVPFVLSASNFSENPRPFDEQIKALTSLKDFCEAIEEEKLELPASISPEEPQVNAEVNGYEGLRYEEIEDVLSVSNDSNEQEEREEKKEGESSLEDFTIDAISDMASDDEPVGLFYVLDLETFVNSRITFRDLEAGLDQLLGPIKGHASNVSIFPS